MSARCTARARRPLAAALLAGALALLAACGTDRPKPTPLESFAPSIAGRAVWNARVDGGVRFPLVVAVRDEVFYAAGSDGTVLALDAATGRERWRAAAGAPLSAGVGADGRFTAVVTTANEVVVFDAGRPLWRQRVASSVVTPPLVAGERVFVMGVDRAVHAFDALDGRRLWSVQRPGDALTLAQAGVVAPFRNLLLVGQGSRLAALDPLRGTPVWDVAMATPRGTNEVERLADLVGPALRVGDRVCARAFQAAVACMDAARGTLLWSRNAGGTQAIAGNADVVVGADAGGRMTGWRAATGEVAWSHERLLHRGLSGGLAVGPTVVFGDVEGQVHFLSAATGQTQLRLATDGSPVVGTPVAAGATVLVTTRNGGLFAFRPE